MLGAYASAEGWLDVVARAAARVQQLQLIDGLPGALSRTGQRLRQRLHADGDAGVVVHLGGARVVLVYLL